MGVKLSLLSGVAAVSLSISLSIAVPAAAQSCTDQSDCAKKASAKIVQTLTPKVVPIFGDYPKLYIHDSYSNLDYPVSSDTRQAFDFYTNKTSFNLPAASSITSSEIAPVDPETGFTVLLVQKTRDNTASAGGSALSLLSTTGNDAYLSISLGARNNNTGQKWSFGKGLFQSGRTQNAYWQKAWDMDLLGPTGSFSGTEWVYYTFTPDGKVRIDRFAPYTYFLAFTAYQWDQAVLDGGFPHAAYSLGTPTARPQPVVFGSVGSWLIGAVNVPGRISPFADAVGALPGIEGITIFSSPLSQREVVGYQGALRGSYFLDVDMLPCNSGQFIEGQIRTPCGTAGPGSPPSNVATVAQAGLNTNVDIKGVILSANDGSGGSFTTIKAAISALPASGGTIRIPPGTYNETLDITQSNVRLIGTGEDASEVVITGNHAAAKTNPNTGQPYGTSGSYTVAVEGGDVYMSNLTIQNTADYEGPDYGANGQAVALYSKGDRAVYRAIRILGGQDTLYVGNLGRAYFSNCYVEGNIDYIFGNGKAVFDNCTIKTKIHDSLIGEATVTAQERESASENSGFVFSNAKLIFDSPYMSNVWLGRPWGAYSTVYFLNSTMGPQVTDGGWIEFIPPLNGQSGTNNLPTSTYREYNTRYADMNGQGATPFNIALRETTSPRSNISLTAAEASALAPDIYLSGNDGWQPTHVTDNAKTTTQQVPVPVPGAGVPKAPIITAKVGGNGDVQVTWAGRPANPSEQGYTITARQHGRNYGPIQLPAYAYTGYIEVALNDEPVTVQVSEVNATGSSPASDPVSVTPTAHDPSIPTNIQITPTATGASLSFTVKSQGAQPVFGGTVPHAGAYAALFASELDAYQGKAINGTSSGFTTSNWSFSNLAPNTTYWMSLRVFNGSWSPTVITSFRTKMN
ncbi:pectinesterase family protein [Nitrospirillum sp. BR 11752]|uniref:pectinesterase family protein n=1 Tax=Nitrospirillum sp. BR 11752 TaxID=3104293 RepID=UPI002EAD74F8|nr:pectinesterase family protein [Nitrospirillum sp. BR 11752]